MAYGPPQKKGSRSRHPPMPQMHPHQPMPGMPGMPGLQPPMPGAQQMLAPIRSDITYESNSEADSDEYDRINDADGPHAGLGSKSEVKIAYGVRDEEKNRITWENDPPEDVAREQAARQVAERLRAAHAIVHRKTLAESKEDWTTHSIQINSHKLQTFINEVLSTPKSLSDCTDRMMLHPPFKPLFEAGNKYEEVLQRETDEDVKLQAELLYDILLDTWKPYKKGLEESKSTGQISSGSTWTLFPPGTLVVYKILGQLCVGTIASTAFIGASYQGKALENPFSIQVHIRGLNWNGSFCGWEHQVREIFQLAVVKTHNILSLPAYPLSYHPDPDGLKKKLIARGRKFESLRGYHFKSYKPPGFGSKAEERIVVDAYAYEKFSGRPVPIVSALNIPPPIPMSWDIDPYEVANGPESRRKEVAEEDEGVDEHTAVKRKNRGLPPPPPPPPGHKRANRKLKYGPSLAEHNRVEFLDPLTNEQCLLAVPFVYGFDLSKKRWRTFNIIYICDIKWDVDAFSQLVLDEEQKRLILALSKYKQRHDLDFDDFITNKGKGIIMLLCGSPGVGKTLTGESVAEELRAPLYRIGAGDLGIEADELEDHLERALEMCTLWKAVMLLDEADVFMETRKVDSLERNELVSVFLRLLEYYKGIMFLTTNRVAALDPAFESRVDLIVPYHDLGAQARREVWSNFIVRLKCDEHEIGEAEMDELAGWKLNGREIKSLIKTGLILGKTEDKKLTMDQLRAVWSVRQKAAAVIREAQAVGTSCGLDSL